MAAFVVVACSGTPVVSIPASTGGSSALSTANPSTSSPDAILTTPTTSPSTTKSAHCPNPDGGSCLGVLPAGSYTTAVFHPTVTYLVLDGWANYEDTPGNFLLVPPGDSLAGVNAGTSDYIGIYTSVAAAAPGCDEGPAPGVGRTGGEIAKALAGRAGLKTSSPRPIAYGTSLKGVSIDITLAKGWTKGCSYSGGQPTVQVITGVSPTGLDHGMNPGLAMRLFLLNFEGGALAIEVDDLSGGGHLDGYGAVVTALKFGVP